ncbi:SDR family NAD(P)-dependent oxidoreductase [Microbulbifer pacificus]|uniref:SDR family NAD(P)-dependent oxidoreductase n=1 Tax=Microbulbifer pacificus TaxID=407164 RepID=UPI000CF57840|nr:SDR family oxidoreductase [Microbulbifer pacificus]
MSNLALITGGSRGLGRSSALALAERGTDSVITYHSNRGAADEVVAEVARRGRKAVALQLDVADTAGFARFVSELQQTLNNEFDGRRLDALLNNAGMGIHTPFAETTEAQFDSLVNVHLKGVFFLTQSLLPLIEDGGRIINVSSGLARFSLPGYCAYAMMKGGIEVMTRYLAKELGGRQIRVNTLAPGAIETDFGGGAVRDNAELNQFIASQTALGRAGLPEDIGKAVAMLLSDEASWVTGQRLEASGGMFL